MVDLIDQIDFVVTETEAEAFLAEQNFIKQYRPLYNVRLRDDKSYPYIAISLDEEFPRIYFTRERHRRNRAYFGPFSNAKRVRETLDLLGKVFQYRTCDGPEPGRASGSPCLDYFIKRCQAPCVGYVSAEEYRRNVDSIVGFLSGRYREIERELERDMQEAAAAAGVRAGRAVPQPAEGGPVAAGAPAGLQRGGGHRGRDRGGGGGRSTPTRRSSRCATASWPTARASTCENEARRDEAEVAEEFLLQYYASAMSIPPQVIVPRGLDDPGHDRASCWPSAAAGAVEVRHAERGDKRRIFELAERNARLALDQDRLRSERRRTPAHRGPRRPPAGAGHGDDPDADRVLRHLEPGRDAHRRVDGGLRGRRAEEVRLPALRDPRGRAGRLRRDGRGAQPPHGPVRGPQGALAARPRLRRELRRRCPR